jgi:zinc/manganese transport system substrate-binding protein
MRRVGLGAAAAVPLLFLAACGSSGNRQAAASAEDGVSVVASTNVYGDIAATVGGPAVQVTSIIGDPSADPHSFEASARTQLTVSRADVVVENGGGYDAFLDTLLSSTGTDATVVNAVDVSGKQAAGGELNEHVWYDVPTMREVAGRIASALAAVDPGNAATYTANAADLTGRLDGLIDEEASARTAIDGAGVAVTEPLPGYLLDALGAEDRTPAEFSKAIEEGNDVSAAVLEQTLQLLRSGSVRALVYNEQTTGPETQLVLHAARNAGVALVPVTETLPAGEDYVSWMRRNVDAVAAALSS